MKKIFGSLMILLTLSFSSVMAEEPVRLWEAGARTGISLPGGNNNDMENLSPTLQLYLDRMISEKNSLGLEFGHSLGHELDGSLFIDIDNDGVQEVLLAEGNTDVNVTHLGLFFKRGKIDDWGTWGKRDVRIYFLGGAGVYRRALKAGHFVLQGTSSTGIDWGNQKLFYPGYVHTNVGINLGFGLGAQVWEDYRLGFDVRYHRIFVNPHDSEYYMPTLTFSYLF